MPKETAEQKLLKLIEAEEGSPAEQQVAKEVARSVRGRGFERPSAPAFLKSMPDFLKSFPLFRPGSFVGLKQINVGLSAIVLAVAVFLGGTIVSGIRSSEDRIDVQIVPVPAAGTPPAPSPVAKGEQYLSRITERRNIFYPAEEKPADQETAAPVESRRIVQKTQNLRLVGVSWLESAETATAMIEDKQTLITYFLKQGEEINGVRIQNIYRDRVVLGFQGETLVLKL